jgi:CxxC motif-containing protein
VTEKIKFYWIPGHCEVKVNERANSVLQSNRSKKTEVVKNYYQWQILEPSGKRKAKRSFTISVKTPKGIEEKATFKCTTEMARLRGSARYK